MLETSSTETTRISGDAQVALGPEELLNLVFHSIWWLITTPCVPIHKTCHFKLSRCGFSGKGWWQQWRLWQARSLHETSAAQCSQIISDMKKIKETRSILTHAWMPPKIRCLACQWRHRSNPILEKRLWAWKVFSRCVNQ